MSYIVQMYKIEKKYSRYHQEKKWEYLARVIELENLLQEIETEWEHWDILGPNSELKKKIKKTLEN